MAGGSLPKRFTWYEERADPVGTDNSAGLRPASCLTSIVLQKMDPVARLVVRILLGERYEAPSEKDSRYWMSVLAVLPMMVGSLFYFVPLIQDAPLIGVWAGIALFGVVMLALVGAVFSIPARAARIGIILVGWAILLSYYGRQFVLLMRY